MSGALAWTADRRERYANDLAAYRSLNAMTDNLNQSKGDRDPAEWLPPEQRCTYVRWWVAGKYRWSLTVDAAEKAVLAARLAGRCGDRVMTVLKASDPGPAPTGTPTFSPTPTVSPSPTGPPPPPSPTVS